MKKLLAASMLGALSALAFGQTQPGIEAIRISGALTRIELPAELRNIWADEFDQVKGSYRLSNGKTMELSLWGNRMYARVDGMPRSQLVAASPYEFVALDRHMKIRIRDVENSSGPIIADVMLLTPSLSDAAAPDTLTRLVASR